MTFFGGGGGGGDGGVGLFLDDCAGASMAILEDFLFAGSFCLWTGAFGGFLEHDFCLWEPMYFYMYFCLLSFGGYMYFYINNYFKCLICFLHVYQNINSNFNSDNRI